MSSLRGQIPLTMFVRTKIELQIAVAVGCFMSKLRDACRNRVLFKRGRTINRGITSSPSSHCPKSFSFSGCGWLSPYFFGVLDALDQAGCLDSSTIYAGTSGGALAAVVGFTRIDPRAALEAIIETSQMKDIHKDIDSILRQETELLLRSKLDTPVAEAQFLQRVNNGSDRLNLCVTKVWPNPSVEPLIVSKFSSVDDVIDVTAASCFIPVWSKLSDVGMRTSISSRGAVDASSALMLESMSVVDGGFTAFMPPVGECKVSPFPARYVLRSMGKPHICLEPGQVSLPQLLYWVLNPAPPEQLRALYDMGMRSTELYLEVKKRETDLRE